MYDIVGLRTSARKSSGPSYWCAASMNLFLVKGALPSRQSLSISVYIIFDSLCFLIVCRQWLVLVASRTTLLCAFDNIRILVLYHFMSCRRIIITLQHKKKRISLQKKILKHSGLKLSPNIFLKIFYGLKLSSNIF